MELRFSDRRAREGLERLQVHQQMAVGAACCERMLPAYVEFMREEQWGDIASLRTALDIVWDVCARRHSEDTSIQELLSSCEAAAPDGEDFSSLYVSAAQDAASATCALVEFVVARDPEQIVRVLRCSTDSVDLIVQEEGNMDPRDAQRERKILEHPLMQQELSRQRRDIIEASRIDRSDGGALLVFRRRAAAEANLVMAEVT